MNILKLNGNLANVINIFIFNAFVIFPFCAHSQEINNALVTVRAVKKGSLFSGFDVLKGTTNAATIRFSSEPIALLASKCSITKSADTIEFSGFQARSGSGVVFGKEDFIRVRLIRNDPYPEIEFNITISQFDNSKWQATVGKEPFHFLALYLREAETWHTCGWLNATPLVDPFPLLLDRHAGSPEISAYHYNRNWSYIVPLGAHPIPVIGLWSARKGHYVGYEFQTTRAGDNSERDIATGYRWIGDNSPNLDSQQFVALVYPYGGYGYQQLVLPEQGSRLNSKCRLLWNLNLPSTDDPNRFVLSFVWDKTKDRLPRVPAVPDVSWIPGGIRLKDFQGPPRGGLIAGVEPPFQVQGTRLIGGWTWHNESPTAAAAKQNDSQRIADLKNTAAELMKYAKKFQVNGEDCVFWERPLEGEWTEQWGGKPVTTLHNANGFAAARVFLGLYRDAGMKEYLPVVDGVLNWAKYIQWTRNEFADVPSSPFAIGGTLSASFCLEYYKTFKDSPDNEHRNRAALALELARAFTYRYMIIWLSDNNRFDNLDSSFLWEGNSGRDWTGAASANEVFWNLDTLAQTAVHTGDPILMWALQGSLDRWHQLYQDVIKNSLLEYQARDMTEGYGLYAGNVYGVGKRAQYGFAAPLVMTEPVGNSFIRILAGEKAALAIKKGKQQANISQYKYKPEGNFAFTVHSERDVFDVSLTSPYSDISQKSVSIFRNGKKIALNPGSDFTRPPQALWSLYVKNIRNGDRIIVGDVDENAPVLPSTPPLAFASDQKAASRKVIETVDGFNLVPIPYDSAPDFSWESPEGWAGMPRGRIWVFGVPFNIEYSNERCVLTRLSKLSQTLKAVDFVYLLYSDGDGEGPALIYSDGTKEPVDTASEALAWKAHPPLFKARLLIGRIAVKKGKSIQSIAPGTRMVWAMTAQTISDMPAENFNLINLTLTKYANEWRIQKSQELTLNELRQKIKSLPENKIAILPPSPGGVAHTFLQRIGLIEKSLVLNNQRLVDSSVFNPQKVAVAIYLDSEDYVHTVNTIADGAIAVENFLKGGGTIVFLASGPWPMFYATGGGDRRGEALTEKLGLPLSMAVEGIPSEKLTIKINPQQNILKLSNSEFSYPQGDGRLRAILRNRIPKEAKYTPIATVVGESGKDYGDAAGLIEFPNGGKLLYIASVLQLDTINGFDIRRGVAEYLIKLVNK
ncbi:MAG: hypothetical protein ACP5MG_10370 [Verrucomicrobiia bacterium]